MMSADDEILQRAQPKGFKSNAAVPISPGASSRKKNMSFSLRSRMVTPDKNYSPSNSPSVGGTSSSKKLFGSLRGSTPTVSNRGGRRSIEKEQKMQDEYYEDPSDYDGGINSNHEEEEELNDGELPSLSPSRSGGGRFRQLASPLASRKQQQQPQSATNKLVVENSPAALLVHNPGTNRNMAPTSERDYETLKVAGFWSQLDAAADDDSTTDDGGNNNMDEEMPNDERQSRNRAMAAATTAGDGRPTSPANNSIGLSLVENTSSDSTGKTSPAIGGGDGSGGAAAAAGGWNLIEMAKCFAADHRLLDDEENTQGLDRSYNPNARVVSPATIPNNGRDTPFSLGEGTYQTGAVTEYEDDEEEGVIEIICNTLGNVCGFGGDDDTTKDTKSKAHSIIAKRKLRQSAQYADDGDSVFDDLDGQEDVAIELGYVEPDETIDASSVMSPTKKKKKGWKSFLGIKKKSPTRKTLVTETTLSGREPIEGDTTKVSDLNAAHTYSGDGLNPLDDNNEADGPIRSPGAVGAATAMAMAAGAAAGAAAYADDDEELQSQAANWDTKRKNMYLRQLASQAKAQNSAAAATSYSEEGADEGEESILTERQLDTPETYTADYTTFNPSDKSKFLRFINDGMSPQEATRAVIQEREAEEKVPDNEEVVNAQSQESSDVQKGGSSENADEEDDEEIRGLVEELENQPVSQSEVAVDSKNFSAEAYQDRAKIPMVPAIVRTKSRSKSRERRGEQGDEVEENQDGLISSGIQYYDAVPDSKEEDDFNDDDSNLLKKRSSRIGRPRLSKPNLSSNMASSFASRVSSKRFDSSGMGKSKYGKVSESPNSFENADSDAHIVTAPVVVEEEETKNREVDSGLVENDEVSSASKPKAIAFDLMKRNREKNFSKLESDVGFALPSVSAKDERDDEDIPSWAQSASKDTEASSVFSPPIENMDDAAENDDTATAEREVDGDPTPQTEYDEDTMSLMGQTFMTGATAQSRRRRHKGAADTRAANAKQAESHAGAKSKGWIGSIQDVASKNGQVWHPEKGWMDYAEPEVEHHEYDNHSSIGRLQMPQNGTPHKSIPPQAGGGFTSPRSVAGTEFDDQSVVTKLTVNTAAESPSILTTSTAPTRRAGRKPRPTDQRKIAAAHANRPIGWKDSMQNAANGVDGSGGFVWDYDKGWIRVDGASIEVDEASALTESVFYNEGNEVDQTPKKAGLLPVTEESSEVDEEDEGSGEAGEDVFENVDHQQRQVNTARANDVGASTRTVDYDEKYGMYRVNSDDGSEKENSPANNVGVPPLLTTESRDREEQSVMTDHDDKELPVGLSRAAPSSNAPTQERSNPLLTRIMAAQDEVPKFEDDEPSREVISREPSGLRASQFIAVQGSQPSRDPSGQQASQLNSAQEEPSGKTPLGSAASSEKSQAPKKSLNTWLESSNEADPRSTNDTEASHLQQASIDAVKTAESTENIDSFNLESFEDENVGFGNTQVIKEKFSDTESDLFQPFESDIKKNAFESYESENSDNDWVSTNVKRQSPLTTNDAVSQKARVWMDSMQKEGETEESSESDSNEPQVNQIPVVSDDEERKTDPPQNLDPPSANIDTRNKQRAASSWIKSKDGEGEPSQMESKPPTMSSNVGSLRAKFENKDNSALGGEENDVIFQSQAMGIRLKRGEDGYVRVVSVTQASLGSSIERVGVIEPGDIIKDAAGIDLRSPITNSQWGEAVTQIRHAPRPMKFIVAAGPERKKEMPSKPIHTSAVPPSQITGGRNVVEYQLSKTADGQQVVQSVREYRRHHSPERAGLESPDRRQYGSPDKTYGSSPDRSDYDSPDRTVYTEASSVYSEDAPKGFFNRMAACATAGAAACAPGGARSSQDDGEKSQVPMAHLQFLRTNPTITKVTNAAKNRYPTLCGRPDTIFEEPDGGPAYDLGRSKSGTSRTTDNWSRMAEESRTDDKSRSSFSRLVAGSQGGDNTAFLDNLLQDNPPKPKAEVTPSQPNLKTLSYSSGGEVGWPENNEVVMWPKDTIDNVSTFSNHSSPAKKETAREAERLAAAKVEAMMEDLDNDENLECEI